MKSLYILFFSIIIIFSSSTDSYSQTHPNSPVYKDYKPADSSSIFRKVDDSFKLWQSYFLIKEANSGNPLAEHELGIRYLTGRGFPRDTVKSFYWIKKAADKKLPPANYNLGLLLNNGWGADWNPYEAYLRFSRAAKDSMPEALYAVGLLNTDNLVVARNYKKAYDYIKKSADMGFKPAKEILPEFHKIGFGSYTEFGNENEKTDNESNPESSEITFFELNDSSKYIDDQALLKALIKEEGEEFGENLGIKSLDSSLSDNSNVVKLIMDAAENGSPEALALLGRCYEKGTLVEKDRVKAAANYIRAFRLDSQNGSKLLFSLLQDETFFEELNQRVSVNDVYTQFVWASLTALQFSNHLTEKDAFELLKKAAYQKYIPAVLELGMCYYSGIFIPQDKIKAIEIWRSAADAGSSEAKVRIAIANLQGFGKIDKLKADMEILNEAADNGSLIAVAALAHCYLNGIGVEPDKAHAVNLYRKAAQRGSRGAHSALKRIYDEIRPDDNEFLVLD